MKTKIIVKRSQNSIVPLDCDMCGFALRDLEDVLSQKKYKKCTECRTNHAKTLSEDN